MPDASKKTLFDATQSLFKGNPDLELREWHSQEDSPFIASDLEIFNEIWRSENVLYSNTVIAGPLILTTSGQKLDCRTSGKTPFYLDGWIESDRVQFKNAGAIGILYIEKGFTIHSLTRIRAWEALGLILICGYGIPLLNTRRLLHRMSVELKLPVYVLADNDTWGYFIYSVIKRGVVAPNAKVPELAVSDVRFLGARAGELRLTENPKRYLIAWKDHWDLRLRAMAKYPCFKSAAWKKEFAAFKKQGGKYEIAALVVGIARTKHVDWRPFASDYLARKIKEGDWLT